MLGVLRDLRRPRYAALCLLVVIVAALCAVAGTWQIARYIDKHVANDDLRANARDAAVPVASLLPTVGTAPAPARATIEFRSVTATGRYDAAGEVLVRRQQIDDRNGYVVLTPLRTSGAVLLVERGFVAGDTLTLRPQDVPAPPDGQVTVSGRVQPSDDTDDTDDTDDAGDPFAAGSNGQVDVVDVARIAGRLATPVYAGYVELDAGQPGVAGLTALPGPDLNNPAGGAFEWQHLAYVAQWYLFAALALAAPFVMIRADRRRDEQDAAQVAAHLAVAAARNPAAIGAGDAPDGASDGPGRDVVLARTAAAADRIADRYGR